MCISEKYHIFVQKVQKCHLGGASAMGKEISLAHSTSISTNTRTAIFFAQKKFIKFITTNS